MPRANKIAHTPEHEFERYDPIDNEEQGRPDSGKYEGEVLDELLQVFVAMVINPVLEHTSGDAKHQKR